MTILLYFSKYHSTALRLVYTYFLGFDCGTTHSCNKSVLSNSVRFDIRTDRLSVRHSNLLTPVTGRYIAINRVKCEQRVCTLCNLRDIEDDFHSVLKCPAYTNIRPNYISFFTEDLATLDMFFSCSHCTLVLSNSWSIYLLCLCT